MRGELTQGHADTILRKDEGRSFRDHREGSRPVGQEPGRRAGYAWIHACLQFQERTVDDYVRKRLEKSTNGGHRACREGWCSRLPRKRPGGLHSRWHGCEKRVRR